MEDEYEPFGERMPRPAGTLREQQLKAARLDAEFAAALKELEYGE